MSSRGASRRITRRQVAVGAALAPLAASGLSLPAVHAQDKKEVRIASYTVNDTWDATVTEMIEAFNAQSTAAHASIEFRPGDQYWDKLQIEFAGGQAPDITLANSEWVGAAAARGMFVDLKPFYERDQIDQSDLWFDMTGDWGYEGGQYGALLYVAGQAMYVNTDLLEAAGEPMPAADWTWDDLLASAKRLTNEAEGQYGITIGPLPPPHWSCSFIQAAGGSVLNDARDECTLNTPEARAGLQWIVDLMLEHKVMPTMGMLEGQGNPFMTGKIAYFIGGTWEEASIRTAGFNWDFVPMPKHPTTGAVSVQLGSNAWSMLGSTGDQEATWEVLKYLGGPEGAQKVITLGIPGYNSVVEGPDFLKLHEPQDIMRVVEDYRNHGHDYYTTPDSEEWITAVANELGPMWIGEDTVENSTQRATDRVNDIFAQRGSI